MKRIKPWLIGLAVIGVIGIYAYIYRDWFEPANIQIFHRITMSRPLTPGANRAKFAPPANTPVVVFGLDRKVQLTRVKVFDLSELATNPAAQPIWHLVAESNSVSLKGFVYGERIKGMQSYVKDSRPLALQPAVAYRLVIESGSKKGQHEFSLGKMNNDPSPTRQ